MIQAFLDESGIHEGAEICVIAGYYGESDEWRNLEAQWRAILRGADVPIDKFHALDLIEHRKFFFQMERARHDKLKTELANAIASSKVHPVTVALIVSDFRALRIPQKQFFTGATIDDSTIPGKLRTNGCPTTPYFMPFLHCVRKVFDSSPDESKVDFHFGFASPFHGYATEMFKMIRTRNPAARNPIRSEAKETPQMQAADFLCYTTYKHALERHAANDWNAMPAELLTILLTNLQDPTDCQFFDKATIAESLQMTYERTGNWDGHL
jgi:Protein of unknown function (DUF3800)